MRAVSRLFSWSMELFSFARLAGQFSPTSGHLSASLTLFPHVLPCGLAQLAEAARGTKRLVCSMPYDDGWARVSLATLISTPPALPDVHISGGRLSGFRRHSFQSFGTVFYLRFNSGRSPHSGSVCRHSFCCTCICI